MISALALMAVAWAGPSAPLNGGHFKLRYSFGAGLDPDDVCVYENAGRAQWVFVADRGAHRVVRYLGDGFSNTAAGQALGFLDGPTGVAVNDIPGHCNRGLLYVTDSSLTSNPFLKIYDQHLNLLRTINIPGGPLAGFGTEGVCVDGDGNVFVADGTNGYKLSAADCGPTGPTVVSPALTLDGGSDCSVDMNGRIHFVGAGGNYRVCEPDGTVSYDFFIGGPGPEPRVGICARNPKADGYISVPSNLPSAEIERARFDWPGQFLPIIDVGAAKITAGGLEYHRLKVGQRIGRVSRRGIGERLFVADYGNGRISVYSADFHYSRVLPLGVQDDCVAWWRFEEAYPCSGSLVTLKDSSGVGNHATPMSQPRILDGLVGRAFETRGGNAWAQVPNKPSLNFGLGSMTVEGWLRTEQDSGVITLLDKRSGGGMGYSLYLFNGLLGFQTNIGLDHQNYSPGTSADRVADGTWHHFAVVLARPSIGSGAIRVYVDGELVGTQTALAGNTSNSAQLIIGRHNSGNTPPFNGAIDELALYRRALSAADIKSIYDSGFAGVLR